MNYKLNEDKWVELVRDKINSDDSFLEEGITARTKVYVPYSVNLEEFIYDGKSKNKQRNVPVCGLANCYECDLVIYKYKEIKVIIECKIDSISTHDILTYGDKAIKHKRLFNIKYGMMIAGNSNGKNTIDRKFLMHENDFDFIYCLDKDLTNDKLWANLKNVIDNAISDIDGKQSHKDVFCIERREILHK